MPEAPYPGPKEPTVTYSLREIVDQINSKLDLLPQLASKIENLSSDHGDTKVRVTVLETKVDVLEKVNDQESGAAVFRDKAFAKLVGLASVMGVIAGATIGLINLVT